MMAPLREKQPTIAVRGGFLRSLENHVAIIRGLGFQTHIKLFSHNFSHSADRSIETPLTILVENVRGYEVDITHRGGKLYNVIRSKTSIMFEVKGYTVQKITITYPHQSNEFDFILFGDTHGVLANLQQIIATANTLDPLFIMSNGDITHNGRLEDYHSLSDIINQSDIPFFTALGNHDKRARGSRKTYRTMLAPFYYSFDINDVQCIVLDSSRKRGLPKFQYKWLERELQLAKGKRILVFLHRPPICPKYNYLAFSVTTNARRFMKLMEDYQVEMVFGSHIHVLTEFTRGNVRYIVTGGGGGALWQPANTHHYLHVFVKRDGIEIKVIQLPTPEAKISQRLKDGVKFMLEFHLNKNKLLKQLTVLGTTVMVSRTARQEKRRLRVWKK